MHRRRRNLVYCVALSIAIHALLVALLLPALVRVWHAGRPFKEPAVAVTIIRMAPPLVPRISSRTRPPLVLPKVVARARPIAHAAAAAAHPNRALSNRHHVTVVRIARISASELARDQAAFSRTIAQARAAQDPVNGAQSAVVPEAIEHYGFAASSISTVPSSGQGYLSPMRRWVDGDLVYYYVRYSVTYPDGTFESGIVPWPIHFPLNDDPFARGVHSMPLPGPDSDYASTEAKMRPLVKNCYDHRYDYCPIEHEREGS